MRSRSPQPRDPGKLVLPRDPEGRPMPRPQIPRPPFRAGGSRRQWTICPMATVSSFGSATTGPRASKPSPHTSFPAAWTARQARWTATDTDRHPLDAAGRRSLYFTHSNTWEDDVNRMATSGFSSLQWAKVDLGTCPAVVVHGTLGRAARRGFAF